ncbi:hypothetical protein [Halomonas sp. HAL1]|uniref:hypothetical protein n=1 Tax=Halomonas sp. HAL1 TaxID=550984 RepID=UPI00022D2FAA|nr:hypothetical protein [Halomonas sp. HAL1]EHA14676.1 hypothetical protein HAL1_15026 [Halomonas sp. HAL1]WKV93386.1 hypothetical protein Q3Y66_01760 [Halomonas sp. HAL1]
MNLGFDTFRFKQLIFVNSAAYAYTQIRIDQHTALFGENNLGKTSMLNALKLFLLPEVNFRNCGNKFNFRGTNGKLYDGMASFRYYFPEDRAFIILEAENSHDDFCIVLHRGGATEKMEYARMVVPCPYAELEPLFWDVKSGADGGIGAPVESMTLQGVKTALREMGGEPLSDWKTIQERLFTNQPYNKKAGRFSLLPLRNGAGKREMDAWRKLVHLAFDISASNDRTLPDTLATIIEGQKSRKQEELNLDLNAIVEEANQLRDEGDRITRIRNASDNWMTFHEQFLHEQQLRCQTAKAYADLHDSVAVEEERLTEALVHASNTFTNAENRAENLERIKRESSKAVTNTSAEIKATGKQADNLRKDINDANATLNEFPTGTPRQEIIENLEEHIAEQVKDIEGYNNKAVAQQEYSLICQRLEKNTRQAKHLEEQLSNRAPTLLDDLSVRDANILFSLNRSLGTTHGTLTPEQKQAFVQFSQQFHSEDGHLMLGHPPERIALGDILHQRYDAEQTHQTMQNNLDMLNESIAHDQSRRDKLREEATLGPEEITRRRKQAEQELIKAQDDKNALNALDANNQKLKTLEGDLRELEAKLEEQQRQQEKAETDWNEVDVQRKTARQAQKILQEQAQQIRSIQQRLDRIGKDANNILEGRHKVLTPTPCEVSEANIEALEQDVDGLSTLRNKVHELLRQLLARSILSNANSQAHLSSFTGDQVADFHDQLKAVFDNLDTQEANYRHQVDRHNKTTHSQVEILRTAKEQVSAFMSRINAEMGQFSISDLEEVRVDYRLHPRFEQLLADLEKADLLSDELQDSKVYEQLKAFQADFFNADARRTGILLSLDKILASVHYKYRKRGKEGWTTNAQSNGTTMMITTNLLSVLMSRLMDGDAQVTMPLVMDEFGSLATRNMRTARQMAEQHGYCLFVANPNRDSKITQVLSNYVHLGLFHASRAYAENRTVVHHGLCESLTRKGMLTVRAADTDSEGAPLPEEEDHL